MIGYQLRDFEQHCFLALRLGPPMPSHRAGGTAARDGEPYVSAEAPEPVLATWQGDTQWIYQLDYRVDPKRVEQFYAAIKAYYPALEKDCLQPAYSGIRPKVVGPGDAAGDFIIQGCQAHGVPGLVTLYGIESPGLTASLAIGDYVLDLLAREKS
jgi:glycine/D-amino acid oxidase-like deaminating enzyme